MTLRKRIAVAFTSTRWGAKIASWTYPFLDRLVFRLSAGKTTLIELVSDLPVAMITTTGAKSGLSRTTPIIIIRHQKNDKQFALIASNFAKARYPAWYHNMKANPAVTAKIGGMEGQYVARELEGEEYEHYWKRATEMYSGYPKYKERVSRKVPVMLLEPVE